MAAPTLARPHTDIGAVLPTAVAGTLGLTNPSAYLAGGMRLPTPSTNGNYGCRVNFTSAVDISARKFITFKLNIENCAGGAFDSLRIYFFDGAGNYSAFLLYARSTTSRPNWQDFATSGESGFFVHFSTYNSLKEIDYTIALDATPMASSGTLNWSDLVAYEIYCDRSSSAYSNTVIQCGYIAAVDTPSLVAGESGNVSRLTITPFISDGTSVAPYRHYRTFQANVPLWNEAFEGSIRCQTHGFYIGDGVTLTYFDESKIVIAFRPTYNNTLRDQYPAIHCSNTTRRVAGVNASASDYVRLSTATFTGSEVNGGDWDFEMIGSSSADVVFTDVLVFNAGYCQLDAHTLDTVVFKKCGELRYGGSTLINCSMTNNTWSGSKGLVIEDAPGDYSSIELYCADNTGGYDIYITPTATGTYDLSGITVKEGQSLKIHNNSATAITVKLQAGISTTLSGGSITVEYPFSLNSVQISGLHFSGSYYSAITIFNDSVSTTIPVFDGYATGATYSDSYLEGSDFSDGDTVRVIVAWYGGATAKLPETYKTVASATGWSILVEPKEDTVYAQAYNLIGLAGEDITEFTSDYPNIQFDFDFAGPVLIACRCYLWYVYQQWFSTNSRIYFHGCVTAENLYSFVVHNDVVDLQFQNVGTNSVLILGRVYRDDGNPVLAPGTAPAQIEYGTPQIAESGVSGLTPAEAAALLAIPTNTVLATDARLDNLDSRVSDCLQASDYIEAPTLSEIESSTVLAKEATVASRLASADYVAPDNSGIAAIPTLSEIEASTVLAKEATVSSRLAAADYVEPDNTATLAAIAALNDPAATDIAASVLAAAAAAPIHADLRKAVGVQYHGDGSEANKLRSILVP